MPVKPGTPPDMRVGQRRQGDQVLGSDERLAA